jgi:hypothetical protein
MLENSYNQGLQGPFFGSILNRICKHATDYRHFGHPLWRIAGTMMQNTQFAVCIVCDWVCLNYILLWSLNLFQVEWNDLKDNMNNSVFWGITSSVCRKLADVSKKYIASIFRFEECLFLTSCWFLVWFNIHSWRCKRYIPPKLLILKDYTALHIPEDRTIHSHCCEELVLHGLTCSCELSSPLRTWIGAWDHWWT